MAGTTDTGGNPREGAARHRRGLGDDEAEVVHGGEEGVWWRAATMGEAEVVAERAARCGVEEEACAVEWRHAQWGGVYERGHQRGGVVGKEVETLAERHDECGRRSVRRMALQEKRRLVTQKRSFVVINRD
jgi:hypothetical protein